MIYSPLTLPIIWRCRVRVEYPGTVGVGCAALVHVAVAPCTSRRTTRAFAASGVAVHSNRVAWIGRAALVFRVGHTSPSPLRSFASAIAQVVNTMPADVR